MLNGDGISAQHAEALAGLERSFERLLEQRDSAAADERAALVQAIEELREKARRRPEKGGGTGVLAREAGYLHACQDFADLLRKRGQG